MGHGRGYLIQSICMAAITVVLWTIALLIFIFQFHKRAKARRHSARGLRRNRQLRAPSIAYASIYLVSWTLLMIGEIADLTGQHMLGLVVLRGYSIFNYTFTNIAFYVLILSRLKLTFQDTVHEVNNAYIFISLAVAHVSVITNTWWRVYWERGDEYLTFPDSWEPFIDFCVYQFFVIDALLQLSVIWIFNRRLFRLITESREDLSHFQTPTLKPFSEIAGDLNHRQQKLIKAVSKHSLLTGIMVSANLTWMIWCIALPAKAIMEDHILGIVDGVIHFALNFVQLFALYLGFDFANDLYNAVFPGVHKICERCCKRLAVKHIEREMESQQFQQYNQMEKE